jgi:hypothetical protein
MITLRGGVLVSHDETATVDQIKKFQVADPENVIGARSAQKFEVYAETQDGLLIPRYCPVVSKLVPRKDEFVHTELSVIGAPDSNVLWAADRPLRSSQLPGAANAEEVLIKKRGCVIRGDTGSGKTVVGLNMVYRLQPEKVLILVDQLDIAKQWAARIREFLPNANLEYIMPKAEAKEIEKSIPAATTTGKTVITIATAQSLHRSTEITHDKPFTCELLICDEVHVFAAPTFMSAIFKVNFGRSIGLTATADRKDGLQWIFHQCLGWTMVEFAGEVMDPIVYKLTAPSGNVNTEDWKMAWCRYKRGMTWHNKCKECPTYSLFPNDCGGNLPMAAPNRPAWDRLNRAGLLSAWVQTPEDQAWLKQLIEQVMKKEKNIFFFGDSRVFLINMAEWAIAEYGKDKVGIYLGKGGDSSEPDWVSEDRDLALTKPLTFCTYGVARKAIDVKEKDTAIFATPISDARQAAGRVRRTAKNKKQPIVIVPVPDTIYPFRASWRKIEKQFRDMGWKINYA